MRQEKRKQQSELDMTKLSSLLTAGMLLIASIVFGAGVFWALQMLNVNEYGRESLSSQAAILLYAFVLFKFDYKAIFNVMKKKLTIVDVKKIALTSLVLLTIGVLFSFLHNALSDGTQPQDILEKTEIAFLMISSIVLAPIFEELAFRAGLRNLLNKGGWKTFGYVLISSTIFGCLHLAPGELGVLPAISAMLLGVVLSVVYIKTNKIMIPMISHMIYNSVIITLALMVQ